MSELVRVARTYRIHGGTIFPQMIAMKRPSAARALKRMVLA
jgi:hypothetical protein